MKTIVVSLFLIFVVFFSSSGFAQIFTEANCPVVGNTSSHIYHVPGGQFYQRMLIKNKGRDNRRCFGSEVEAVRGGFRKSRK